MRFMFIVRLVMPIGLCVALASCAGHDVVGSTGNAMPPLEKNSLSLDWKKTKTQYGVSKHERGRGLQVPTITADEKAAFLPRTRLAAEAIYKALPGRMHTRLGPYLSHAGASKYTLAIELNRVGTDTDGSREVLITAYLIPASESERIWSRSVSVAASRFNSDEALVIGCEEAILGEMRSSGLIE